MAMAATSVIANSSKTRSSDASTALRASCNPTTHLTDLVATVVPSLWNRNRQNESHIVFMRFVNQVLKVMEASTNCVLIALLYIYRLYVLYPDMVTQAGFEVRTFTTALMLANKYLEDYTYKSKSWADVTGINLNELNLMEGEFMSAIHYRLHVTKEQLSVWVNYCQSQIHTCYYCHNTNASSDLLPLRANITTSFMRNKQPVMVAPTNNNNNNKGRPFIDELPEERRRKSFDYQHYHQASQPQLMVSSSLLPYSSTATPTNNAIATTTKKRKRDEPPLPVLTPLKRRNYNGTHTTARHSNHHPPTSTTARYVHLTSAGSIPEPYHHQQKQQQQHRFAIPIYP
ncbi:hypothetical protein BDB00DRAFT_805187 [Zychaea mexicana]|uniref:uncharacterized protein n=1 Tax=Zychaea mexicana TaxID=64656 RepID=UPI0022FF3795|nr:uncharacterized protein BDB00DRAFT_805187 [Zychaea mexicana]KAI9497151.1 hypothetical protein BDB00DRAFT_805187 [Zychaea mexicana]